MTQKIDQLSAKERENQLEKALADVLMTIMAVDERLWLREDSDQYSKEEIDHLRKMLISSFKRVYHIPFPNSLKPSFDVYLKNVHPEDNQDLHEPPTISYYLVINGERVKVAKLPPRIELAEERYSGTLVLEKLVVLTPGTTEKICVTNGEESSCQINILEGPTEPTTEVKFEFIFPTLEEGRG